jgi:hypothetical protein
MRPASAKPFRPQAGAAEEEHCQLAASQNSHRGVHHRGGGSRARRHRWYGGYATALVPRCVRGQDQRRDLTGRYMRGSDCSCAIGGNAACVCRRAHPARDRPRQGLNIGGERRVVGAVIGSMVANDVDDRRLRPFGVVQICQTVALT